MSHALCQRIIEGLWAAGVREMVVTPGSRSTPLLLAALESELQLYSVIDERSASFFALGRARARGTKVALLCTSGSAGAHYLPALLEARYAEHCLVALTADRPPELQHCGANQTIDQRQLFAAACPPCVEIGVSQREDAFALAARRRVHQAVALTQGPLHINLAFRKPLEPVPGEHPNVAAALPLLEPAQLRVATDILEGISEQCQSAQRGVIVCGPSARDTLGPILGHLAQKLGFVLLAETTSGARLTGESLPQRCDAFPHVLQHERLTARLDPDLILQFGADPASGVLARWLTKASGTRIRFSDRQVLRDACGKTRLILGDSAFACEQLSDLVSERSESPYLRLWREADDLAWAAVATQAQNECDTLTEAFAVSTVLQCLAPQSQLTLGNSLAIRSADAVVPGTAAGLRVLHQRGTSGIEGLIAGAIGSSGIGPNALLLGDVSCAHDLASLALHRHCNGPLAIFVIDNGGGKIFSHLPIASVDLAEKHWDFWQTPPELDFGAICQGYKVAFRDCTSRDALPRSVAWALDQPGLCMLRIKVAPDSMRSFLGAVQDSL